MNTGHHDGSVFLLISGEYICKAPAPGSSSFPDMLQQMLCTPTADQQGYETRMSRLRMKTSSSQLKRTYFAFSSIISRRTQNVWGQKVGLKDKWQCKWLERVYKSHGYHFTCQLSIQKVLTHLISFGPGRVTRSSSGFEDICIIVEQGKCYLVSAGSNTWN